MTKIYLTRHGQTFENMINKHLNPPTVRNLIDQEILGEMDYNYNQKLVDERQLLREGTVKYSRLKEFLAKQEIDFERIYNQAGGVCNYTGRIISLNEFTTETYIPLLNLTGEGAEQAQILGCYLGEKEVKFLTSTSFRTIQTAQIIARKMGTELESGVNFFPRSELIECFPLEYSLMNLIRNPQFPSEVMDLLGSTSLEDFQKYCSQKKDEARKFFKKHSAQFPPLLNLLQNQDLERCELELTIAEHGENLAQTFVDFTNRFNQDTVAVLHGNLNSALFNYLRISEFNFGNCGLCVLESDGKKISISESYQSNWELESTVRNFPTLDDLPILDF